MKIESKIKKFSNELKTGLFNSQIFQSFDRSQFFESLNSWSLSASKSIDSGFEVTLGTQGPGLVRGVTLREVGAVRFIPKKEFSGFSDFVSIVSGIAQVDHFLYSIPDLQTYDRDFFSKSRFILNQIKSNHPDLNGIVSTRVLIGHDFNTNAIDYNAYDHVFSYVVDGSRTIKTKRGLVSFESGNCFYFTKNEKIEFVNKKGFIVIEYLFKKNDFNDKLKKYFLSDISSQVTDHSIPDYYPISNSEDMPKNIKQIVGLIRDSAKKVDPEVFASRMLLEMVSCSGLMPVPELLDKSIDTKKTYCPVSVNPLFWSTVKNGKYLVVSSCGYSAVIASNKPVRELILKIAKGDQISPSQILSNVAPTYRPEILRILQLLYSMGVFQSADRFVFDQLRPFKSEDVENRIFSARVSCMNTHHKITVKGSS